MGRLLAELQPEPEVIGLLALMLLQGSHHAARTSPTGDLILLENQDCSLWNRKKIAEGLALLKKALRCKILLTGATGYVGGEAAAVAGGGWLARAVSGPDGDVRSARTVGLAYWYEVWPLHQLLSGGMLRGLAQTAEKNG